jgi:hypothetical protein
VIGSMLGLSAAAKASDVLVLRNDGEGITVRYRTPEVSWRQTKSDQRHYRTPVIHGASVNGPQGAPQLPAKVIWLAIPPGSKSLLSSIVPYAVETHSAIPAPIPTETPQTGGILARTFVENPTYYNTPSYPVSWALLPEPQNYRDLFVVRLVIHPFRYQSSSKSLLSIDSIDVHIRLQGGAATLSNAPIRSLEDQFFQGLIANWDAQAKGWKQPRRIMADVTDPWPAGDLYKIRITESGMYRLTYNDLVNAGINLTDLDSRTLRIFNNGGEVLPENPNAPRPTGPIENAILIFGEENNRLDQGEAIWFYGKSVHEWKWDSTEARLHHYRNPYTDNNVYWLNVNSAPGAPFHKYMAPLGQAGTATVNPATTRNYYVEESDQIVIYDSFNLPNLMPNFYGDFFSGAASRTYNFNLDNVDGSTAAVLTLKYYFSLSNTFKIYINGGSSYFTVTGSSVAINLPAGLLHSGMNSLRMDHSGPGTAYLDYYEFEYPRYLTAINGKLTFYSPAATGLAGYNLTGSGLVNPWIFDATDFAALKYTASPTFQDSCQASSPRRYLGISNNALLSPQSIIKDNRGGDEYVNLYSTLGADELVICADDFYGSMGEFETYREIQAPASMNVMRVRVSDIFDDFGWGLVDPAAIRDFLRTTLPGNNWAVPPLYVLFAGDGDYDFKNRLAGNDSNWLIPFVSGSRCTDDWYSYFTSNGAYPELATGRWPAQSPEEIQTLIARLLNYETGNHFGPWQDLITFVADDEYHPPNGEGETEHTIDTEDLAERHFPDTLLNVEKIYLTQYPWVLDPLTGGKIKPGAASDLMSGINQGRLVVNFIGHGNPTVWSDEHVFLQSRDIPLLANGDKLPLFIAATCDWAFWDNPLAQSMPEIMLTLEGGGAIAVIAATRTTYGSANQTLLDALFDQMFALPGGRPLGEALMRAKAGFNLIMQADDSYNNEKYHLLGDPVMRLAVPKLKVVLDPACDDTLSALERVTLTGEIQTEGGTPLPSFQGIAHLEVFDTRIPVTYAVNNDPGSLLYYTMPGNAIFRGDCSVEGGRFVSIFVVPLDISYGGAGGRYSIYAYPGSGAPAGSSAAAGADTSVFYTQTAVFLQDSIPPALSIYFDSPGFRPGGSVRPNTTLYVQISDGNGVNLTGRTGHGITITVDEGDPLDVTDSFNYELNSYTTGRAEYRFSAGQLTPGLHTVQAIAWDAANNPNSTQTTFNVMSQGQLAVTDVLNYPNPMKSSTRFTFWLTEDADVSIKIFTVAGRLVRTIEDIAGKGGDFNYQVVWDGRDHRGDPVSNGVYLYKLTAKGAGSSAEQIGKLMVLR